MQTLGKLLFSVFSLNKQELPPPDAFVADFADPTRQPKSSKKYSRASKTSLFSTLVETKAFPMPICRFLSDLIDIGSQGRAHHPFTSFEDVVADLEQMIASPQIFLHDSYNPQGVMPSPPNFGQVYHGRNEELATLMKVAVEMQLSSDDDNSDNLESVFVSGTAGSGKSTLFRGIKGSPVRIIG